MMKVIVVGGGIAGLTLANALEKAGIDFILLEGRSVLDPDVGASIGLGPGALRIFDQFGAADDILDQTKPLEWARHHRKDGSLIVQPQRTLQLLERRFGYGLRFLPRQLVLRALSHSVSQQNKLLVDKRVVSIEQSDSSVTVHCGEGTTYTGDIVVGCDGVNSRVRAEMWRLADEHQPGYFHPSQKMTMTAEFICLFGISSPVPGLDQEGTVDNVYDIDHGSLVVTGKDQKVFWFFFEKLDRPYQYSELPRYTKEEAHAFAKRNAWRKFHERFTLGDLWNKKLSYTLVAMEEGLFDKWSWGRIANVGDNAHKMTAHHGQAGISAIESAAALANQLKKVHDRDDTSSEAIRRALEAWQAKRKPRVEATYKQAVQTCRVFSLTNLLARLFIFVFLPLVPGAIIDLQSDAIVGSELIEYLPVPLRSLQGDMPFNPSQGDGHKDNILLRALWAAPLLLMVYKWPYGTFLDSPTVWLLYIISCIEGNRRSNRLNLLRFPALFGVVTIIFGPSITPVYLFLHYLLSGIQTISAADHRHVNIARSKVILGLTLAATAAIAMCSISGYTLNARSYDEFVSRFWIASASPIAVMMLQHLLVGSGIIQDTEWQDIFRHPKQDLPYIIAIVTSSLLCWRLVPSIMSSDQPLHILAGPGSALNICTGYWILLLLWDLKSAGMIKWTELAAAIIITGVMPVSGPSLVWLEREYIIANRHEKHAVASRVK